MSADPPSLEALMHGPAVPEPTPAAIVRYARGLERHILYQAEKVGLLRLALAEERAARERAERLTDVLLAAINEPHVDARHGRALLRRGATEVER